jgi:hypothetical protein
MKLDSSFASNRLLLCVTIFVFACSALAAGQQYVSVYHFQGSPDGSAPIACLIADKAGNLYGTTYSGGTGTTFCSGGCGTVFELRRPDPQGGPWTETVLYSFTGNPDGYWPSAGTMVFDKAGNFYGTTQFGGSAGFGYGTIYQLAPPPEQGGLWTETVLYNFTGGDDGGVPANGLTADPAGNLFGTTNDGGQYGFQKGAGTAFQLAPPAVNGGAWTETTLFSFQQIRDGNEPNELTLDAKGNLYGTRSADTILCTPSNPQDCGMAFELKRGGSTWQMKILHQFTGSDDGSDPFSGMVLDKEGNLYGTTVGFGGNTITGGTVFELTPPANGLGPWTERILYHFSGGADGGAPLADLLLDAAGNLYDTTYYGGNLSCDLGLGCGTVFKLAPPSEQGLHWTETVLHTFGTGNDGQNPGAGLISSNGVLYGNTAAGGGSSSCNGGCGTAFGVVP